MNDIRMLLIPTESSEEKLDIADRIWSLWPECRIVQVNEAQVGVVCPNNEILTELRERFAGTVFNGVHDIVQVHLHELTHLYVQQNPGIPEGMKGIFDCGVRLNNSETGCYKPYPFGREPEGIPVPKAWEHAGKSGLIERHYAERFLDSAEDAMFQAPAARLLEHMSDTIQGLLNIFEHGDPDLDGVPDDLYLDFMGMWALHKEAVKSRPEWPALAKYINTESLKPDFLRKDTE